MLRTIGVDSGSIISVENHVSVIAIMFGSSSDIRTSNCMKIFRRHCALNEYILRAMFPYNFSE